MRRDCVARTEPQMRASDTNLCHTRRISRTAGRSINITLHVVRDFRAIQHREKSSTVGHRPHPHGFFGRTRTPPNRVGFLPPDSATAAIPPTAARPPSTAAMVPAFDFGPSCMRKSVAYASWLAQTPASASVSPQLPEALVLVEITNENSTNGAA